MRTRPVFSPASYLRSYQAPPVGSRGDLEIFAAVAERLAVTGVFSSVILGGPEAWRDLPGEPPACAVIAPETFEELADPSSAAVVRHVRYTLCVIARAADAAESYCLLAGRAAAAQNALAGNDLGGLVHPALSRLGRGRFELGRGTAPGRALLHGELGYTVADAVSRVP